MNGVYSVLMVCISCVFRVYGMYREKSVYGVHRGKSVYGVIRFLIIKRELC